MVSIRVRQCVPILFSQVVTGMALVFAPCAYIRLSRTCIVLWPGVLPLCVSASSMLEPSFALGRFESWPWLVPCAERPKRICDGLGRCHVRVKLQVGREGLVVEGLVVMSLVVEGLVMEVL